jgi:hypothetical protein
LANSDSHVLNMLLKTLKVTCIAVDPSPRCGLAASRLQLPPRRVPFRCHSPCPSRHLKRPNTKLTCRGRWRDSIARKTVLRPRSAAADGSSWLIYYIPISSLIQPQFSRSFRCYRR